MKFLLICAVGSGLTGFFTSHSDSVTPEASNPCEIQVGEETVGTKGCLLYVTNGGTGWDLTNATMKSGECGCNEDDVCTDTQCTLSGSISIDVLAGESYSIYDIGTTQWSECAVGPATVTVQLNPALTSCGAGDDDPYIIMNIYESVDCTGDYDTWTFVGYCGLSPCQERTCGN